MKQILFGLFALICVLGFSGPAFAQVTAKPPNILVIWGDDIGYWNVSAYNQGMMGYKTPNIDRIEGGRLVYRLVRPAEAHARGHRLQPGSHTKT